MVVANQALHEDTKVRGPGVEAKHFQPVAFTRPMSPDLGVVGSL